MKRALAGTALAIAVAAFLVIAGGASNGTAAGTYKIELDNAFGLVPGTDFKVAGVPAGTITSLGLDQRTLHAVVTVQVTQSGFGQFRSDVFCQSRPQSLIGEYFIDCQPGRYGGILKPGSTIPVSRTQSTIPADLLQNVLRMPYRERLTLIINELGAAAAGRSGDLQAALRRAVPALTETDNLLNLLADDSKTLQQLTVNSDAVIGALANNSVLVQRFITEAGKAASETATQQANLKSTLAQLPGFLEQLRPAMAKLGGATTANQPVLVNLNAAARQLNRLLVDLVPFSHSALPAVRSLGQASVTGRAAVTAARPTVADLNRFAKPTPELAQNLAIVGHDLDDRSRAVERDSRSPGGKGFTGLEALLQYAFNQTLAINAYSQFGHLLSVDAFVDVRCAPYATPASVAMGLATYGSSYRQCYSWLGPNQPGVNAPDPSNPGACVPDPGGAPPGQQGPNVHTCKLSASAAAAQILAASTPTGRAPASTATGAPTASTAARGAAGGVARDVASGGASPANAAGLRSSTPSQAAQLLNYLLAP
ncbi:MAG: MlaD family protein [Actinomycetota bacterium]|nr:MlaD family protein [Actinomycetota bacterium]